MNLEMDVETGSTNTSIDDKTEDFCENPTRDTLAEGLMCLLKPTIDQLDERVRATRISQLELKQQIEGLSEELKKISAEQSSPLAWEAYANKLTLLRISQLELKQQIEGLSEELKKISAEQSSPLAWEAYANKLTNAKHKITVVSNILQTAQDRLHKVQLQMTKETARRRALLKQSSPSSSAESSSILSSVQ